MILHWGIGALDYLCQHKYHTFGSRVGVVWSCQPLSRQWPRGRWPSRWPAALHRDVNRVAGAAGVHPGSGGRVGPRGCGCVLLLQHDTRMYEPLVSKLCSSRQHRGRLLPPDCLQHDIWRGVPDLHHVPEFQRWGLVPGHVSGKNVIF